MDEDAHDDAAAGGDAMMTCNLTRAESVAFMPLRFPPLIHTFIHTFVYERPSLDVLWDARWPCKWSFDSLIGDQRSIIVWMPGCSGF